MLKKYLLILVFGFFGAMCRYGIGLAINDTISWGTLFVNLIGSFLLPFVFTGLSDTEFFSKELITAMGTGFIGAFTTFSAFTLDIIKMFQNGELLAASLYLFASLAGGLLAAASGVSISQSMVMKFGKKGELDAE